MTSRLAPACVVTAALAAGLAPAVWSQRASSPPPAEYRVKAGFLLNFTRYIEWPAEAFESPDAPLMVCVAEPNPFGDELESLTAGQRVQGHPVAVRTAVDDRTDGCHILFIPYAARARARAILGELERRPTVTVGEFPGFIAVGGMINLVTIADRVRFEIGMGAANRRSIGVSSRLLRLAADVRPN
jgi:hypothetical protein